MPLRTKGFRRVDDDGQVVVERRKVLLVKVDGEVVDQLVRMSEYAPPPPAEGEQAKTWGGKRTPCPKCGSTRRRTVVSCGDCGLVVSDRTTDTDDQAEDVVAAMRAETQPDEPRADAESIPPTVVEVPQNPTYPPGAVSYERATVAADDEPDTWDPYECTHGECKRRSLPGKRYCDWHDPQRQARYGQRAAPVVPVAPPVAFTVPQGQPQGFSRPSRAADGVNACARCGTGLYSAASHCIACRSIIDGVPLKPWQVDPLGALSGDVAAGGDK